MKRFWFSGIRWCLYGFIASSLAIAPATLAAQTSRTNAAIMISVSQAGDCEGQNGDLSFIVAIGAPRGANRYISGVGFEPCVVLPIKAPIGAQISIYAVMQDTEAIPRQGIGSPAAAESLLAPVACQGFAVEAFSVGLDATALSQINPRDLIVDAQGYGLAYSDGADSPNGSLTPGTGLEPYEYVVGGCDRRACSTNVRFFSTVQPTVGQAPRCTVLAPFAP